MIKSHRLKDTCSMLVLRDFFSDGSTSTVRRVLEAKVAGVFLDAATALAMLRLDPCDFEPLAPRAGSEAAKGGVALVPFGDQLLEVARPLLPHIQRGVRLEELVQPIIADPLRLWEFTRVPGREIAHDARFKLPLQGLLQGGGLFTAGWRGGIDTSPL